MSAVRDILASRLLTRIGDQAWDFAVPLALVAGGPTGLRTAAIYTFGRGVGMVLIMPWLGRLIDRWARLRTARLGTLLQAVGVAAAGALLARPPAASGVLWLAGLIASGLAAALGSSLMEIAVASDLIPAIVLPRDLTRINSRIKQIDLGTETVVPVATGLVLALRPAAFPALGFALVAVLNVLSFYPEYLLLARVLRAHPELNDRAPASPSLRRSLGARLREGWTAFRAQPALGSMVAFACLWFTVLSPHGTLITGYLKQAWDMPELALGVFRGLGAVFGLAATLVFPWLVRRRGLVRATRALIVLEAAMLVAALVAFRSEAPYVFLVAVLCSRVGMYGFSLGESEIRQRTIPAGQRGHVNGTFAALTSFVSLALAGTSTVFATPETFGVMVAASVAAVTLGAVVFTAWSLRPPDLEVVAA